MKKRFCFFALLLLLFVTACGNKKTQEKTTNDKLTISNRTTISTRGKEDLTNKPNKDSSIDGYVIYKDDIWRITIDGNITTILLVDNYGNETRKRIYDYNPDMNHACHTNRHPSQTSIFYPC